MDIVSRLKLFMAHTGLPTTQFADEANIPRPTISQILNGRNRKISNEVIAKLHDGFPSLNILWLLFGDGDMEVREATSYAKQNNIGKADYDPQCPPKGKEPLSANNRSFAISMPNLSKEPDDSCVDDIPLSDSNLMDEDVIPISMANAASSCNEKRKVSYVMVFYNDNSYEVLRPEK